MSKTRAELVAKALSNLGFLAAGQSVPAEDSDLIDGLVDNVIEELSGEQVIEIADDQEFDDSTFLPLARILAEKAAPEYGRETNEQAVMLAKALIRKITYGRPTREPLTVDFF